MKYAFVCLMLIADYSVAVAATVMLPASAVATTCDQRARECRRAGLGGACTEPFRLANCRKTGIYTAPNGVAVEAKGR